MPQHDTNIILSLLNQPNLLIRVPKYFYFCFSLFLINPQCTHDTNTCGSYTSIIVEIRNFSSRKETRRTCVITVNKVMNTDNSQTLL